MTQIFKTVLSMSLSGAILIAVLLCGIRLLRGRLGRQWQYYIWMIVVMRLLLPFGPEVSLMGQAYRAADRMMAQGTQMAQGERPGGQDVEDAAKRAGQHLEEGTERSPGQNTQEYMVQDTARAKPEAAALVGKYLWVIWLAAALGMLIRKISMYQSYIKYVKAGAELVGDLALLDQLAVAAHKCGINKAVELCVNPLVASPMLVGYFHPSIVLPSADVSEREFCWIAMHELTHYRRRDILYKWLVQAVVCLHWFNPFVHMMSREIDRACEFACDEAVVAKMGYDSAADYGKTLLNAMAAGGTYREPLAAVNMSANKELLRERLGAIMNCKKHTKVKGLITVGLTACVALGAFFIGVYPSSAAEPKASAQEKSKASNEAAGAEAERYYEEHSLPLFYIAFGELDERAQEMWLDRIYADRNHQFFSVCVWRLDGDSPLIQTFAQRFYEEDDVAFFSILADEMMSEEALEGWLEQALSDQKWNFQSMLYDKLNRGEEKDELEKALETEQKEAYRLVGVTWNGKNCYYEEQLVHIFLDIRMPDRSFYTLDMNPAGTVDIKIERAADGKITGVGYLTEAEVAELFGDMGEDVNLTADKAETKAEADAEFPRKMTVCMPVCRIREGAGEEFQVVGLLGEGETVNVLGKKEAADGQMWYLLDRESLPQKIDASVKVCYVRGDLLEVN